VSLPPIGPRDLGRRAAMERGHPGFMAVVEPPGADAATRIAARLGRATARLEAPLDAQALAARLNEGDADPLLVSGLDGLTDDTWRQLDRLRGRLDRNGLTMLVLTPLSADRLTRHAPHLASLFGAAFFRWEDALEAPPDPASADVAQTEFDHLARRWRDETAVLSSLTRRIGHPAYEAIIAMGERAIRPILRELERGPELWGPALHAITGALPVPAADAGRVARVAEAWLAFARENGYVW
jgi:hypothetical protein